MCIDRRLHSQLRCAHRVNIIILLYWSHGFFIFTKYEKTLSKEAATAWRGKTKEKINYISYSYPFLTTIVIMTNNINIAHRTVQVVRSGDSAVSATINFTFYPFPPDPNDAAPRSTIPTLSIAVHNLIKSQVVHDTKISIKLSQNLT